MLQFFFYLVTGILIFIVSLAGFSARWALTKWAELDVDEIIQHLRTSLKGTGGGMISEYLFKCALPVLIILAMYIVILICVKGRKKRLLTAGVCAVLSLLCALAVKNYVWEGLNVSQWLEDQKNESHLIEERYVDPAGVKISFPQKKKNLIFLYLESMETTYADEGSGGAFEKNIIPELTELAVENEDFSGADERLNGGVVYKGSHNTMAAIYSHMSGLPLKVDIGVNNMDTQDSFFPDIVTLGDILEKEGYRQVFLMGSDAEFGGRGLFFKDHGGFEIRDLLYAREEGWIPEDYYAWWGYEDEKLFQFAKETLLELAESPEPFHLSILTADTHFEDGYVCRLCRDEFGDNQYANVMACSSRQVAQFIEWIRQQDFYRDTVIVLTGDHITMDNDFCESVSDDYQRRMYTAYLNAAAAPALTAGSPREYCTYDTFPTTIAALGAEIEGNRLGLGVNLFSDVQTMTEIHGVEYLSQEIPRKSSFLRRLESTRGESEALLARIRENMKDSVRVISRDPENDRIELEVIAAPDLYMQVTSAEVTCREISAGAETDKAAREDKDGAGRGAADEAARDDGDGAGRGAADEAARDDKDEITGEDIDTRAQTFQLELKSGKKKLFRGWIDLSELEETECELSVTLELMDGSKYEDVVVKRLSELPGF